MNGEGRGRGKVSNFLSENNIYDDRKCEGKKD
jgi:hypothetical protein